MAVYTTNIAVRIHVATFAQIVCTTPPYQAIVPFVCCPPNQLVVMELRSKAVHIPLLSLKMVPSLVEMLQRLHVGHLFLSPLSCVYSVQCKLDLVVSAKGEQGATVTSPLVGCNTANQDFSNNLCIAVLLGFCQLGGEEELVTSMIETCIFINTEFFKMPYTEVLLGRNGEPNEWHIRNSCNA